MNHDEHWKNELCIIIIMIVPQKGIKRMLNALFMLNGIIKKKEIACLPDSNAFKNHEFLTLGKNCCSYLFDAMFTIHLHRAWCRVYSMIHKRSEINMIFYKFTWTLDTSWCFSVEYDIQFSRIRSCKHCTLLSCTSTKKK